jgi:hydroxyethylthiazole kinase-like uncharacterized protein yjeF
VKPVVTADEYRRVDKAYPGDLIEAMDRAGHAVALSAARHGARYGKKVVVLAGPGNNGGDGYVAARYLRERGAQVEVHALAPPKTEEATDAAEKAKIVGVPIVDLATSGYADLVIDALFGGGVREGIPTGIATWMKTDAPVIAVDYPTGLDPDSGAVKERAFRAVETVTFGTLKTGHVCGKGPEHCGAIVVADIGIEGGEPSMFIAEDSDAPRPWRRRETHKWAAGSVLVVGGSAGMVGAAIFAGRSALNFGAGTVYLAAPRPELTQLIAPELPALTLDRAINQLNRFDVIVAGPGLSDADAEKARPLLRAAKRTVLDAGGLTPVNLAASKEDGGQVVITPHDAEFARIAGVGAGAYSTRAFADKEGITVLRKGNPTMISGGGLPVLVTTGGPELASIGTGDVLAGMIGALWARGLEPTEAAISAAYWHGAAGSSLARERTVTAAALTERITSYAW